MTKTRLEAFSDGVIAIIITIMVLELKVPHEATLNALYHLLPIFECYLLSFVFVAIYWGNHHHLLHTSERINAKIIWANMALLFCLSLIPFTTAWMGENHFAKLPVALYGMNLLICAIAFYFLQTSITSSNKHQSELSEALGKQLIKGYLSLALYSLSVICALFYPIISAVIFVIVAIMWIIPDKNIERALSK